MLYSILFHSQTEIASAQEKAARTTGNANKIYINTTLGHSIDEAYYNIRNHRSLPKTAIKVDELQDVVFSGEEIKKTLEHQFKVKLILLMCSFRLMLILNGKKYNIY